MTEDDFRQLIDPAMREWIAAHRAEDAHRLALQKQKLPFSQTLAVGQVALLQKAAAKLPRMAAAQCVFSLRAFEQSTSEAMAAAKPYGAGARALDLTCGLGGDSFAMSGHFAHVTALEPDAAVADMARFNASLLGIHNLEVVQSRAEDFLTSYSGLGFDLIYVDPDRRTAGGKRVHALSDCSPDVVTLLPRMRELAPRVLIKASPMLDLMALERMFPGEVFLWVLSEGNECKELLLEFGRGPGRGVIFLRKGEVGRFEAGPDAVAAKMAAIEEPSFVMELDTALYKASLAPQWLASSGLAGAMQSPMGFVYATEDAPDFHGHRYRILDQWPWKPQAIRSALKSRGIQRVQFVRRDFDLPTADVLKSVGIPEGGAFYLLLTRQGDGNRVAILAERLG
ncbi:MAG: RsmD family RNA methyltransferase [Bacteroidia bacterium]